MFSLSTMNVTSKILLKILNISNLQICLDTGFALGYLIHVYVSNKVDVVTESFVTMIAVTSQLLNSR